MRVVQTVKFGMTDSIHQLSFCHYAVHDPLLKGPHAFPDANYFRYEHLIATLGTVSDALECENLKPHVVDYELPIKAAGVLHDLGHPDFSHTFEDLLEKSHEVTTYGIITKGEIADALNEADLDPEIVADIATNLHGNYREFHDIVANSDRVTYQQKDSKLARINPGFWPERILKTFDIDGNKFYFNAPTMRDLEEIYHMKENRIQLSEILYGSPSNRSGVSMVKEAGEIALREGVITEYDVFNLSQKQLLRKMLNGLRKKELERARKITEYLLRHTLFWPLITVTFTPEAYKEVKEIRFNYDKRFELESRLEKEFGCIVLIDSDVLPKVDRGEILAKVREIDRKKKKPIREWDPIKFSRQEEYHERLERTVMVLFEPAKIRDRKVCKEKTLGITGWKGKKLEGKLEMVL